MKKIASNALKIAVPILISAGIIYYMYRDFDFSEVGNSIREMKLVWLWFALAFSLFGPLLRGLRWRLLLEPIGYRVPRTDLILIVFFGYAANIVIPRIGEVSRYALLDRRDRVPFSKGLGTWVAERFVDLILLIAITSVTLLLQWKYFMQLFTGNRVEESTGTAQSVSGNTAHSNHIILLASVAAIAIAICIVLGKKYRIGQRIIQFFKDLWTGFATLKQIERLPLFIAYSIGIWICYYLEMYLAFYCIGSIAAVGPMAGLACFVASSVTILIPTPNGAGPWHFAVTSMLMIYGISANDAKTFALVLHSAQTATYLLSGALAWVTLAATSKRRN